MNFPLKCQNNSQILKGQLSALYRNINPRKYKTILNNKITAKDITIPAFKLYHRT